MCFVSASWVYYFCISAINCTGKNASKDVLLALGEAEANVFLLCSDHIRPSKDNFFNSHF